MKPLTFNPTAIERQRRLLNLSRRDLMLQLYQKGIDVTEETLTKWEDGRSQPDVKDLATLSGLFNLPVEAFYK